MYEIVRIPDYNWCLMQALALAALVHKAAAAVPGPKGMPGQRSVLGALAALQTALDNTFATKNSHFSKMLDALSIENFAAWQERRHSEHRAHGLLCSEPVSKSTKLWESPVTWPINDCAAMHSEADLIGTPIFFCM